MSSALGYPLCAWLPTAPNLSCNVLGRDGPRLLSNPAGSASAHAPPAHLRADHGHGLALRGVDLARHDGGAGLVLGQLRW